MSSNINQENLEAQRLRENNLSEALKGRKTRSGKKGATVDLTSEKDNNTNTKGNEDNQGDSGGDDTPSEHGPAVNRKEKTSGNINMDDGEDSEPETRQERVISKEADEKSSSNDSSSDEENEKKSLTERAQRALSKGKHAKAAEILAKMTEVEANIKSGKKDLLPDNPLPYTGEVSSSHLKTFSAFWVQHIARLDIHLPLTIFNREWIESDNFVADSSSSKSKTKNPGKTPINEWYLTYADWVDASQLMIEYLNDSKHFEIAKDMETHFKYVQKLKSLYCWVVAFRYDISVRRDVSLPAKRNFPLGKMNQLHGQIDCTRFYSSSMEKMNSFLFLYL